MSYFIWIITVMVSYLLLRTSFKYMSKDAKESAPIIFLLVIMLVPVLNLVVAFLVWGVFFTSIFEYTKCDFIDKVFFIKSKSKKEV